MILPAKLRVLVVLACLAGPASAAARPEPIPRDFRQESALLEAAGPGFSIKRTPHFLVAYDSDRSLVAEFIARIEHTYHSVYRFCDMVGIDAHRPDRRLEVLFFDTRVGFDRYAAELGFPSAGTYGLYFEPTNRSAFFNVANDPEVLGLQADIAAARENLDRLVQLVQETRDNRALFDVQFSDGRRATMNRVQVQKEIETARRDLRSLDGRRSTYSDGINRTVVQHEVAHQVLFNAGVHVRGAHNPQWIVEGLACLFETPPGAAGAGLAAINQRRLRDFRSAVAGDSERIHLAGRDLSAAIAAGRIIPPQKLVSDPTVFNARGEQGADIYAATWALTHYLQRTRTAALAGYLQALSSREPGRPVEPQEELDLFEKHFGPLDDTFVARWGDFILKIGYRSTGGL